jgi:hypothetical protein
MNVLAFLYLEASQSDGSVRYQLGLGCYIHPKLASLAAYLSGLF